VRAFEKGPLLTLVTDGGGRSLPALARAASGAGIDHFQVREKGLADRELCALVREVVGAAEGRPMRVLVNGRPDIAAIAGAHGVQLPEEGLPLGLVRKAFPGLILGASRHSIEGVRKAEDDGADFVALGPIFETPGKESRALGPAVLERAVAAVGIPVFAIGGIDLETGRLALAAGAAGLMAIRLFTGDGLGAAVSALKRT
jgi:thiamine-phosphate pyrophosphorylase